MLSRWRPVADPPVAGAPGREHQVCHRATEARKSAGPVALYRVRVTISTVPTGKMPGRTRAVLFSIAGNLAILAGVLLGQWPAGNVYLLFWVENVILMIWTIVRINTAGIDPGTGRPGFFALHYGMFCFVHLAFVVPLAFMTGFSLAPAAFLLPIVLLLVRYAVEATTTWFGGGARMAYTPAMAMAMPCPHLIVLHVATILGWGASMATIFTRLPAPRSRAGASDRSCTGSGPWAATSASRWSWSGS